MPPYIQSAVRFLGSVYAPFAASSNSSSQTSSDNLLELQAKDVFRVETEENGDINGSWRRLTCVPNRLNMTENKYNILTASISLLFVRSKMAVCILNQEKYSLCPLTLQPADHFRTQNRVREPPVALAAVQSPRAEQQPMSQE